MTKFKQTFKVVDYSNLESSRSVKVNSVTITNGTLKSGGIKAYTISPEVSKHEFMRKSGYTKYLYEGNNFTELVLHNNGTATLYEEYFKVITIEISEEQLLEWKSWAKDFMVFSK